MERDARYAAVGGFVVAATVALILFVIWLGTETAGDDARFYRVFFTDSVTGLQVGSPVRYRGVSVGNVRDIAIDPDNPGAIAVTIAVVPETPIFTDSLATLELAGISGGIYVLISGGTPTSAPLTAASPGELPVIPSESSGLQAIFRSIPEVLMNANEVLVDAQALLSDENQRALTDIVQNVLTISDVLAQDTMEVGNFIQNLDGLVTDLRVAVARISGSAETTLNTVEQRVNSLSDAAEVTIVSVGELTDALAPGATALSGTLNDSRDALTEFFNVGLAEFTLMTAELRIFAALAGRLVERLERDPSVVIFGEPTTGVRAD